MSPDSQQAASTIDQALLARVAKGDQVAFGQLYDLTNTLLYSMAFRILGTHDEAAELLHNVYFEVRKRVARFDSSRSTPIAWLITLTRSRAMDRLRARGDRLQHEAGQSLDSPAADYASEGCSSEQFKGRADQDLRQQIATALSSLPAAQRQAIELAYYNGLSYTAMALKLNQSPAVVKTRMKLGMTKLREFLRSSSEQHDHP